MYVDTNRLHRHGKTYRTITVRESFRQDGKVMHRTVANITDLPQHAIDAVQQAFRSLKTVSLEMRPFHHHLDDRIRSHVFLCMLAYYVQWQARRMLEPLFAADGVGKNRLWTWQRVVERLKGIRIQSLFVGGTEIPNAISQPDKEQRRILELLEVKL